MKKTLSRLSGLARIALFSASILGWGWAAEPFPKASQLNVPYGSEAGQQLDFWAAKSDKPTPVLVYIHGGGWSAGTKELLLPDIARLEVDLLNYMLDNGVSVAAIDYRLTPKVTLPTPVTDAARAVQFLRSKAATWNIDRQHFAAVGSSAGACTSLWLAFHEDLADPKNLDPVLRESTRLCGVLAYAAQTSIDPDVVVPWIGSKILEHSMLLNAVGAANPDALVKYHQEKPMLMREYSPINHVSSKSPPIMLVYRTVRPLPATTESAAIHHAVFGFKLKEKLDAAGVPCILWIQDQSKAPSIPPNEFLLRQLRPALFTEVK